MEENHEDIDKTSGTDTNISSSESSPSGSSGKRTDGGHQASGVQGVKGRFTSPSHVFPRNIVMTGVKVFPEISNLRLASAMRIWAVITMPIDFANAVRTNANTYMMRLRGRNTGAVNYRTAVVAASNASACTIMNLAAMIWQRIHLLGFKMDYRSDSPPMPFNLVSDVKLSDEIKAEPINRARMYQLMNVVDRLPYVGMQNIDFAADMLFALYRDSPDDRVTSIEAIVPAQMFYYAGPTSESDDAIVTAEPIFTRPQNQMSTSDLIDLFESLIKRYDWDFGNVIARGDMFMAYGQKPPLINTHKYAQMRVPFVAGKFADLPIQNMSPLECAYGIGDMITNGFEYKVWDSNPSLTFKAAGALSYYLPTRAKLSEYLMALPSGYTDEDLKIASIMMPSATYVEDGVLSSAKWVVTGSSGVIPVAVDLIKDIGAFEGGYPEVLRVSGAIHNQSFTVLGTLASLLSQFENHHQVLWTDDTSQPDRAILHFDGPVIMSSEELKILISDMAQDLTRISTPYKSR